MTSPEIHAVDENAARAEVVEPREEIHECGLPGTAAADDGHHLPRSNRERHGAQDVLVSIFVAEADIPEFDGVLKWRAAQAPGCSFTSVCVSNSSKIRSDGGDCLLEVGVDATELLGGSVHQEHSGEKRGELPRVIWPTAI